jgi:hypothetical protein
MSFDGGANFSASFSFTDPFPFQNETVPPDAGIGNFTNCTLLNGTMDGNGTCFVNGTAINNATDGSIYLASHQDVHLLYARADQYRQRQHRLQSAALGARYAGGAGDDTGGDTHLHGGTRRLFSKHGKRFNSFRYGDPEARRRHLRAQEEREQELHSAQWQRYLHGLRAIDTGPLVGPGFTGRLNSTLLNCFYLNGTLLDNSSDVNCSMYMNATVVPTEGPTCPATGKLNLIRREVARASSGIIAAAVSIATFDHPDLASADAVSVLGKDQYAASYRAFTWDEQIAVNATLRMTWVGVASCASAPRVVTLDGHKHTLPPPCYYHITWSNDDGVSWFDFGPISEPRTKEPWGWFGLGSTPDPNFCLLADPYALTFMRILIALHSCVCIGFVS